MKRRLFTLGLLSIIIACGCSTKSLSETKSIAAMPTATHTPSPTVALTSTPLPTAKLTNTPLPTVALTNTSVPTSTATSFPLATAGEDGKVYLESVVLFDIHEDAPGCFDDIPIEIAYSPSFEHFLVIPACIEGDNHLFLFRSDGSGKQRVTDAWDWLNFNHYEWASDGQSFTYERINSCCLSPEDIPADAPPQGLVQVDVTTLEKTFIGTPVP